LEEFARMKKVILALALFSVSWAANAITVNLIRHNQTSGSGAISTLINDGSQVNNAAGPSTAVWDWDGTTLSSSGVYSAVSSIGSSSFSSSVLGDLITDLSIDTSTSTASATSYACSEGNFLATVGASGCGGYNLGTNFANESTTIWGPGLAVSRTIGGDDVITGGPPRDITSYDFGLVSFDGTTLIIGNGIPLGSTGPTFGGGEEMVFEVSAVPVPAAAWLFGSALGLLGWARRRAA
jgi:hypothetical protein